MFPVESAVGPRFRRVISVCWIVRSCQYCYHEKSNAKKNYCVSAHQCTLVANILHCSAAGSIIKRNAIHHISALVDLYSLIPLTYPDLRDKLRIDCRQCRMQGSRIEMSVHGCRKEDQRGSPRRLDLQLAIVVALPHQLRKRRVPAAGGLVEVDQDGHRPLSPIGKKTCPVSLAHVEGVVVGKILLGAQVPAHLWEFHVTDWLLGQLVHLPAQPGKVLPGQVAGRRGSGLADDPVAGADDGCRSKRSRGDRNKVVALLLRQKILYLVNGRIAMDLEEARVKGVDSVEFWHVLVLLLFLLAVLLLVLRILGVGLVMRWLRNHDGNSSL